MGLDHPAELPGGDAQRGGTKRGSPLIFKSERVPPPDLKA